MPLDTPVAESDIVTFTPPVTEVGALALITLNPETYVAEVFKPFRTKLAVLVEASEAAKLGNPDLRTVAGMAIAIKHRAGFRDDLRIEGEETRAQRKAPMLKIGKLLDSEYKDVAAEALPHEKYWDDAIKATEAAKVAEKAEKERVEAERVAAIRAKIADISSLPAKNIDSNSATLYAVLSMLAIRPIEADEFAELVGEARAAVNVAGLELDAMHSAVKEREKAEADRLAELAAEKKRNAEHAEANRLAAIENERIANEQAAESLRLANLAAAQEAEATRLREKAAANLAAELAGIAEQVRRNNEAQAEADAKLKAEQAAFEAQKAEFAAAVKVEADHAEAIEMDAAFDEAMARAAELHVGEHSADIARCGEVAQAMLTNGRSLVRADADPVDFSLAAYSDAGLDDPELTDAEIAEMGKECGMELLAWVARLEAFCERARAEWAMP